MTEKKVILSETVRLDIGAISDFIISVSRPEHAERYRCYCRLAGLSCKRLIFSEKKYKKYADPEIFSCKIRVTPEIYQSL